MLKPNLRAQVYYNLHHKTFSIQQSGRVQAHSDGVILDDVRFLVGKAGQKKVRETGRKNVHAKVSGANAKLIPSHHIEPSFGRLTPYFESGWKIAIYNPYITDTFVDQSTGEPVHKASRAILINKFGRSPSILYKREPRGYF